MRNIALFALLAVLIISCRDQVQATYDPASLAPPTAATPTPAPPRQPTAATADCPLTSPAAPLVHNLQDMLPGCDYATWFEDNTGYEPNEHYFGDYKILPWDDALYLGFGTARPGESNGSLFARFQNDALTAIYQPSEQGFIDMTEDIALPVIHIPGPDPTDPAEPGGSQWDWGNTYVYTPTVGAVTKHRNLPNVIHTWGLESTSAGLYAAVSSHTGDYKTWTGEVFLSNDLGDSWTRVADKSDGVGNYRTYDIIQFNGKLYVVWNDVYGKPCGLAQSSDGGSAWVRLSSFTGYTQCRSRLFVYDNKLLILSSALDGILALHTDGSVSTHLFPGFRAQDWAYNPLAVDAQNRLYIASQDNRILRTSDLNAWETLVASDRDFITLDYWPNADRIVVGDRGAMGRLWLLNPAATAIQQPASPQPAISLNGDDVVIQWQTNAGHVYRIYRNDSPDFTPPAQYFHDTTSQDTWTDPGAGGQVGGFFYQVRSQNAAGDISGPSTLLGKFTFQLVPGD